MFQPVLSRLMMPVYSGWKGGGLNKGIVVSACNSVREQTIPPALILKTSSSVPPICPWQLPQHWTSERKSPSASKAGHGPFKRKVSTPHNPHFTQMQPQLVEVVRTPFPGTGTLNQRARCVARNPHFSGDGGGSAARIGLPMSPSPHISKLWDQAISHICPSYCLEAASHIATRISKGLYRMEGF